MSTKGLRSFGTKMAAIIVADAAAAAILVGFIDIMGMKSLEKSDQAVYEAAMTDGYNEEVKSVVQTAVAICAGYDQAVTDGELTLDDAKEACKEVIRDMRYNDDESGYLWIDDTDYNLVMHPILPEQEGNNRYDLTDADGVKIIQTIMQKAQAGGGYSEFQFTKSDGVTVAPKVAYSEMYEPWGWVITTGNYTDDMNATIEAQAQEMNDNLHKVIMRSTLITLAFIVVIFLATLRMMGRFSKILLRLGDDATGISSGDLSRSVEAKVLARPDEIGNIARSLKEVLEKFRSIIRNMIDTSEGLNTDINSFRSSFGDITANVNNVNIAVEEIAQGSTSLAHDTVEASGKIGEMASAIDENNKNVNMLRSSTDTMKQIAGDAYADVKELGSISYKTADSLNEIKEQIIATEDSVEKIKKAVDLINEIASQTNLLSLNASIEAARAGESGRGFSVVAEEIRKLAEECATSVSEISAIIGELTANSAKNVEGIMEVSKDMTLQIEKLEKTTESFTSLEKEIQAVADDSDSIAAQVESIDQLKNEISETIESLSAISQENAASTQETSATMNNLLQIIEECNRKTNELAQFSDQLNEQTKVFKLQ